MIKAVRQKKRRKRRLYFVGLLLLLLAAGGGTLHRLSLSLQDISRIIQLAAGKISNVDASGAQVQANLRGTVYDRNFKELSVSYQLFTLYVHPAELADRHDAAEKMARILGVDKDILADRLSTVKSVIEIADDLDRQQAAAVASLGLEAVYCKPVEERFYPGHRAAAHLLGFASSGAGLAGVEALYDPILQPGVFRAADVPELDIADSLELGRTSADIVLTIDLDLQKLVEQQLRNYLEIKGAARGVVLVMDPGTGRLFTMASQPGFDPNYFWQAEDRELQDQVFMPGFDRDLLRPLLVTAAAIYEAGLDGDILPATVRAPDYGLTEEKLAEYRNLFGFSLPVQRVLSPGRQSSVQDEAGQAARGMLSAFQMEVGMASLLNGGSRVNPFFLQSLYDHDLEQFYFRKAGSSPRQRVIEPAEGINLRRELLLNSAFSGKDGFLFANSTTTAVQKNGMSDHRIQEVLLAAAPKKKPEVLLLMAVDYGCLYPLPPSAVKTKNNMTSLTVLGSRMLSAFSGAGSHEILAEHPAAKSEDNYRRFLITRRLELPEEERKYAAAQKVMPEVTGLSLRKGLQRIGPLHMKVKVSGSGRIVRQNPAPGEPLAETGVCELTLQSQI